MTVCMMTGVQGYMRSGFARFRCKSSAVWAPRLRRQEVVLRLTSGPRGCSAAPRRAAISHVFHSEHVKRQTTSARLWHYLLSRAIFETQARPHTCHVFHWVTFMTIESAQYMILKQKKNPSNAFLRRQGIKEWGVVPSVGWRQHDADVNMKKILWHSIDFPVNDHYFQWSNNCSPPEKDTHAIV